MLLLARGLGHSAHEASDAPGARDKRKHDWGAWRRQQQRGQPWQGLRVTHSGGSSGSGAAQEDAARRAGWDLKFDTG